MVILSFRDNKRLGRVLSPKKGGNGQKNFRFLLVDLRPLHCSTSRGFRSNLIKRIDVSMESTILLLWLLGAVLFVLGPIIFSSEQRKIWLERLRTGRWDITASANQQRQGTGSR